MGVVSRSRVVQASAGTVAAMLLLSGIATLGVSYAAADRLVHPPRELTELTPATLGISYDRVGLETEDGLRLSGWWVPAPSAVGTVIFLHGYGASKTQSLAVVPFLHDASFNVLAFDFRAHGASEGTYTTVGLLEVRDVRAAIAHATARGEERIVLFGWSMGAAAALNAAPEAPEVRAVIADSSFASLANVVANNLESFTGLPAFPFAPLTMAFATRIAGHGPGENQPAREAEQLHRPLLIIQGGLDAIARPEGDGARIAEAGGAWAQFWLVPDAGHVDARHARPVEYEDRVVAFLREALA